MLLTLQYLFVVHVSEFVKVLFGILRNQGFSNPILFNDANIHKKGGREPLSGSHPPFRRYQLSANGLLSVVLVGYGQLLTSTGAARRKHSTTIFCCHSLAESVLVHATTIVRLKCSFHFIVVILIYCSPLC